MEWPPVGDITSSHGPLTSLILFLGKIPATYSPFNGLAVHTPLGFHITAGSMSMLFNIYPAEAVFLFGAAILILIPSCLYSLSFIITKSYEVSILAFFSAYLISSASLEQWLFGYFFNGPYPNLFGFLSVIIFCVVETFDIKSVNKTLFLAIITLFQLLTYPTFAIFSVIYLLITRGKNLTNIKSHLYPLRIKLFGLVILCSTIVFFLIFGHSLLRFISVNSSSLFGGTWEGYLIPSSFLYDNVIGLSVLVAAVLSVISVYKKPSSKLALFYLIIFLPLLVSVLFKPLSFYLSILLPIRSVMIDAILAWVVIAEFIHSYWNNIEAIIPNRFNVIRRNNITLKILCLVIVAVVFFPSLYAQFSFNTTNNWDWFSKESSFSPDFHALEWINNNVNSSQLILNDGSYESLYLESLGIKNLAFFFWANRTDGTFNEMYQVWDHPNNSTLVKGILQKYSIDYVFVSSDPQFLNDFGGTGPEYNKTAFTSGQYIQIFDNYSFLNKTFQYQNSTVYQVIN
jgi:hypothetical protein